MPLCLPYSGLAHAIESNVFLVLVTFSAMFKTKKQFNSLFFVHDDEQLFNSLSRCISLRDWKITKWSAENHSMETVRLKKNTAIIVSFSRIIFIYCLLIRIINMRQPIYYIQHVEYTTGEKYFFWTRKHYNLLYMK